MKILVCGGRDFNDREFLFEALNQISHSATSCDDPINVVIHGDAKGADRLAGEWARERQRQEVKCPANWTGLGKRAGYVRNSAMLLLDPDLVIAFPGGRGTAMMIDLAQKAEIKTVEFGAE